MSSLLVLAVCFLILWFRKSKSSLRPYPPGPKPIPILGNFLDFRTRELWLPASQWAKKYGDIVYLHIFGISIVFLNSSEAASDLLDKRGSIYSDKPSLMMVGELCGCKHTVPFTQYGDQFKRQRRLLHKALGPLTIPSYHPLIESVTHNFPRRLLVNPSDFFNHITRHAGAITLSVIYGYEPAESDDPIIEMAEECLYILANEIVIRGGVWPVDVIPWLRYLPKWMPGAGFLKTAEDLKRKIEDLVNTPYEFVKREMKTGNYKASFCSTLLEDPSIMKSGQGAETLETDLKWTANSMYGGSIDTTLTSVTSFILAMMQYPDVQRKAQEEIDSVIGTDRLPTFADRASLPYVEAIFLEVLRWTVPVPLSLPHRLMEDDVYRGMYIPKGSLVFANIWTMLRDENLYPDAESFKPERFLEKTTLDMKKRVNVVFGFGRRQCPGMHLAESSVWLLIAVMLATLKISKVVDECGNVIEPEVKFENSVFRISKPFRCDMRARSEQALSLIKTTEGVAN